MTSRLWAPLGWCEIIAQRDPLAQIDRVFASFIAFVPQTRHRRTELPTRRRDRGHEQGMPPLNATSPASISPICNYVAPNPFPSRRHGDVADTPLDGSVQALRNQS